MVYLILYPHWKHRNVLLFQKNIIVFLCMSSHAILRRKISKCVFFSNMLQPSTMWHNKFTKEYVLNQEVRLCEIGMTCSTMEFILRDLQITTFFSFLPFFFSPSKMSVLCSLCHGTAQARELGQSLPWGSGTSMGMRKTQPKNLSKEPNCSEQRRRSA